MNWFWLITTGGLALCGLAIGGVSVWKNRQTQHTLKHHAEDVNRRMYELAILKELGERIGYSLDVQQIVDIITGSLHQLINYSVVSYMLLQPEKIVFKTHLETSVSRTFITEVRERMLKSLSALLDKDFHTSTIEEIVSGAILVEEIEKPVQSFFNIPLVIGNNVVGVLTVAHTTAGLYKEAEMTILYKIIQQASQAVTRLQEVVQIEERKLNAMVESMTEGVVMTDCDYRIMVANLAAKQMCGVTTEGALTIFDFIQSIGGQFDIQATLEESIKLDKTVVAKEILMNNRYIQTAVFPVKSRLGVAKQAEIIGGVILFHDVTQEKELKKMREDFTSMMVHELRAPLDNIKKMTELMTSTGVQLNEYRDYIPLIHQDSSHMLELVNDLLDAAKIEAGKFEIHPQSANLSSILNERKTLFTPNANTKQITLRTWVDPNIPATLRFDPYRITQVLNNVISNALKFTPTGGNITVQATLHTSGKALRQEMQAGILPWLADKAEQVLQSAADCVVLSVSDTGVGMSPETMLQLFNKFKQFQASVQSTSRGTGLGLIIAKAIVEDHGGILGVESKRGIGSTFYFTLPLHPIS